MARYTDRTTFSRKSISDYAASLRRIAAMLDGNVDLMERDKIDAVSATHFDSSQVAIEKLTKFCGAITEAIADYRVPELEQQPPQTPKKKSPSPKDQKK